MKKILVKIFLCDIMGMHDWTSDGIKGIPPKIKINTLKELDEYTKVYCDRCGKHSKFNL